MERTFDTVLTDIERNPAGHHHGYDHMELEACCTVGGELHQELVAAHWLYVPNQ